MKRLLVLILICMLLLTACTKQAEKAMPSAKEEQTVSQPEQITPAKEEQPPQTSAPEEAPAVPSDEPEQQPEISVEPEPSEQPEAAPPVTDYPEPVRRMLAMRTLVDSICVQDAFCELDTTACETLCRELLCDYLKGNWDTSGRLLEIGEMTIGLYAMDDPDTYLAVLMKKENYSPVSLLIDLESGTVQQTTNTVSAQTQTKLTGEITNLVGGSQYGKNLCHIRYDLELPEQATARLDTDISNALYSFEVWLTDHWANYTQILIPPFFTEFELSENGVFSLLLTGETFFRVEMNWLPAKGVWVEGSRSAGELDPNWQVPESLLTAQYLESLAQSLESGMEPCFDSPEELSEKELYSMFLLLCPRSELAATWKESDQMYHFSNYLITSTLSRYLSGYQYDISKNERYDPEQREIVIDRLPQDDQEKIVRLRESSVNGSQVTAVYEVFAKNDEKKNKPLYIKQYSLDFIYGGYQYCRIEVTN